MRENGQRIDALSTFTPARVRGACGFEKSRRCAPSRGSNVPICSSTKRVCVPAGRPGHGARGSAGTECSSAAPSIRNSPQRAATPFSRARPARPSRRVHDQFREQRIVTRAGAIAAIAETVDADAAARRRLIDGERAAGRPRRAVSRHGFEIDARLNRHAARSRDIILLEAQTRAATCRPRYRAGCARDRAPSLPR